VNESQGTEPEVLGACFLECFEVGQDLAKSEAGASSLAFEDALFKLKVDDQQGDQNGYAEAGDDSLRTADWLRKAYFVGKVERSELQEDQPPKQDSEGL